MKLLPLVLIPTLAACGAIPDPPRSARAQTRLTQALEGKVAGEPRRCISRLRRQDQEIVDRGTILFKNGRNLTYRNDPEGGCQGLDPTRIIVVTTFGSDLCEGDLIRVVDRYSGAVVGSCAFSDFVPYVRSDREAMRTRP